MIKPGDTVTWTSQASGSAKTKIDMPKSIYNRALIAVSAGKDGQNTHYYAPKLSAFDSSN